MDTYDEYISALRVESDARNKRIIASQKLMDGIARCIRSKFPSSKVEVSPMKDSIAWEIDSKIGGSKFLRSSNSIHLSLYGYGEIKVEWPCSKHMYTFTSVENAVHKFIQLCRLAKERHEIMIKDKREWDKKKRKEEKEKKTVKALQRENRRLKEKLEICQDC